MSWVNRIFILALLITFNNRVLYASSKIKPNAEWVASLSDVSSNLIPSDYTVNSITGSSQIIELDSEFGFPKTKLYTFKLCVSRTNKIRPFIDKTITIEGSTVPLKTSILDDSCLTWDESINYHFTSPSRYVTLARRLNIVKNSKKNKISTSEIVRFQFAINPWQHGDISSSLEVADFIKIQPRNPIPASEAIAALTGTEKNNSNEVPLIANDARVNFQELGLDSKLGGSFLFDFRINPQIEVYNYSNQPTYLKLNQGEFEFEAYLISTLSNGQTQERRIINPVSFTGTALIREGALAFQKEILLPAIPTRGRLELAVILKPKQTHSYIRTFKGVYLLGEYSELKKNLFARLKTGYSNATKDFNLESYIGLNKTKQITYSDSETDGMRPLKYEFEPLEFKFTRIGDETTLKRQVYYRVKACIRNGADNTPLRGYHFVITKAKSDKDNSTDFIPTIRMSEYDSCIYWDDRIDHNYYAKQKYYQTNYRLENKDLNLNETLTAYINPWDINLSRDTRTIEPEEIKNEINNSKLTSQFFIPTFKIQTRTINYGLDKMLNLNIEKQVHLIIEPFILNYSNMTMGIDSREPIRDGIWKIKWALLHNRYEDAKQPFAVITSGEQLTIATQGRIIAPLSLSYSDFRFVDSRNYLMLEIAPVNTDSVIQDPTLGLIPKDVNKNYLTTLDLESGLKPQTFIGPLLANSDRDFSYLVPHPENPVLTSFINNTIILNDNNNSFEFEKLAPTWDSISENLSPDLNNIHDATQWENESYLKLNNISSWNLDESLVRIALRRSMGPSVYTLKNFSEKYYRDIFMTEILTSALQRHELTAQLEDRFCFYFFDQNPYRPISIRSKLLPWRKSDYWLKSCLHAVGNPEKSFFNAQIETPIESIKSVNYVGSTSSKLDVGASFNISNALSNSESKTVSASIQTGVNFNITNFFSLGGSTSYSLSESNTKSFNSGNGLSISTGVSLNVRQLTLNLKGTYSQQCLTIELNPKFFQNTNNSLFKDLQNSGLDLTYITQFLTQKARLCFTEDLNKSIQTQENFYLISQDSMNVSFVDTPDLRNRPLLLQLRGQNAYENFLQFIGSRTAKPAQANAIDPQNFSITQRTLRALKLTAPSAPGILIETLNR